MLDLRLCDSTRPRGMSSRIRTRVWNRPDNQSTFHLPSCRTAKCIWVEHSIPAFTVRLIAFTDVPATPLLHVPSWQQLVMSLCWKRLQSDLDSRSEHQEPPPSLQSCQCLTLFCMFDPAVWVDITLTPGLCSTAPTAVSWASASTVITWTVTVNLVLQQQLCGKMTDRSVQALHNAFCANNHAVLMI